MGTGGRMKIIKIHWEDITTHAGTIDKKDIGKCGTSKCISIGYLINKKITKRTKIVKICGTVLQDGDVQDISVIPNGCITKYEFIKE